MPIKQSKVRKLFAGSQAPVLLIVFVYLLAGGAWILFSDKLLGALAAGDVTSLIKLQTYKGWLFVLVTGGVLYLVLSYGVKLVKRSQSELDSFFELSQDMLCIFTLDGDFLRLNPAWEHKLGFKQVELKAKPYIEFVHEDDREETIRAMAGLARGGSVPAFENRYRCKDGTFRWLRWTSTASAEAGVCYAVAHDITERRQAEDALKESEERFRAVVEGASDAIFVKDPRGRYLMANEQCARLLGRSAAEVIGRTDAELMPAELAAGFRDSDCAVTSSGTSLTFEERLPSPGGERILMTTKTVFRDHAGRTAGVCGISRDVTDLRRIEEQLRQAQKMEAVGRLAGGVAHDFNNILATIIMSSELALYKLGPDDPIRRKIEEIRKASDRASNLTRQLLAFSRLQVLQPKVLDLNVVISDITKMLGRLIGEDVRLSILLDRRLHRVKADRGQIEQVLLNLAVNARDAMPDGGLLTIETSNVDIDEAYTEQNVPAAPGPYVLLSVSDTGTGMDEATRARIFEPFFTTKEIGKGTGLGLATVYGIVKQSDGYVNVNSEMGQGATFNIYLPCLLEKAETTEDVRAEVELRAGRETILLVEDEKQVRGLARETLKLCGYRVLTAAGGDEALALFGSVKGTIDLVITDVVMPGMSGRQLAERLREIVPTLRVLYMSGYTSDAVIQRGVVEESAHFIQKPFSVQALTAKVRELLERN